MKGKLILLGITLLVAFLSFLCYNRFSYYQKQNQRTATGIVYEKFETQRGHHKSNRISNEFIMVIKEDNGHYFDLIVSPTTYAITEVGDRVSFKNIRLDKLGESENSNETSWLIATMIMCFLLAMLVAAFLVNV